MVKEREQEKILEEVGHEEEAGHEHYRPYQRYLDAELGLREYWYPALFSHELEEGKTNNAVICGERILFKRVNGKVYGVADRCPHRGATLSHRPECFSENTVSCFLHGFTFDVRDGSLVQVLSDPGSPVIGKITIETYHCDELNGAIFVYIGDGDPVVPLKHDVMPTFLDPNLVTYPLMRHPIKANWRLAVENGYDTGHIYGHRNWAAAERYGAVLPMGTRSANRGEIKVVNEPGKPVGMLVRSSINAWVAEVEGVMVAPAGVDPNNIPDMSQLFTATPGKDPENVSFYPDSFGPYLPCQLDVKGFPRPDLYHWEWYVPIDEDHHMYTIIQGKQCNTPEEADAFRKEVAETLAADVFTLPGVEPEGFNNFDILGRESSHHAYQYEDFWHRERLYRADYAIVEWRKLVAREARGIQTRGNFQRIDRDDYMRGKK